MIKVGRLQVGRYSDGRPWAISWQGLATLDFSKGRLRLFWLPSYTVHSIRYDVYTNKREDPEWYRSYKSLEDWISSL